MRLLQGLALLFVTFFVCAQEHMNTNLFRQLDTDLPTPNVYRTAGGAPGHQYWQQQADYKIAVELDDENQIIRGSETITYTNNSPDNLEYLWIQLDQNMRAKDSDSYKIATSSIEDKMSFREIKGLFHDFEGGFNIDAVTDAKGNAYDYTVNKTMMRIDPVEPLQSGGKIDINIDYWYNINDRMKIGGRSGYEYFEDDDNYLYTIAQFFPRMCVYIDNEGWQNKQFLGRGEFTLSFGNYEVAITVPEDHVVGATGMLANADEVLTEKQQNRWEKAQKSYKDPVIIITEAEARKAEKSKASKTKTWVFKAENVRDFGFASSRKFIWDAMAVKLKDKNVMAISYYPKEGNPLWEKYSTRVVAHTLNIYSKYTFDYPYPQATSVHAKSIGMEYPMICYNFGRPEEDGTYSKGTKYGMIGVIIHEVGHNFFPMIVNSDERQWTWMDEGLNTFVQYLTEQEWERGYPSRRGPAPKMVRYMSNDKDDMVPIMSNSRSILQFGNNSYGKPATALNILRETVMGRELFDHAFKTYAQRWKFKHPTPADFFRTMEDASAVDLDWFWRGWFYSVDHVDIAIKNVEWYKVDTKDPEIEKTFVKKQKDAIPLDISTIKNKEAFKTINEKDPRMDDFYNTFDKYKVTSLDEDEYKKYLGDLESKEKVFLDHDLNYYEVSFENIGGLVMPIILQMNYADGSSETQKIPVEIWQRNNYNISKVFVTKKEISSIVLDPNRETCDIEESNNHWPPKMIPSKFDLYKENWNRKNLMQKHGAKTK